MLFYTRTGIITQERPKQLCAESAELFSLFNIGNFIILLLLLQIEISKSMGNLFHSSSIIITIIGGGFVTVFNLDQNYKHP